MIYALAGLLAGLLHVLSGPDHLAAVAPLAVEHKGHAWRAGVRWGLGHSGGVLVIAAIALILRELAVPMNVSRAGERLVGVAMIAIGLWGLRRALTVEFHGHVHAHGAHPHEHVHVHAPPSGGSSHGHADYRGLSQAAFGMGLLHGVAGGAHFLGILPALALPTPSASAAYIAAFVVGTIAAMAVFAAFMGLAAGKLAQRGAWAFRAFLTVASGAAVGIGAFWIWSS